MAAAIATTATIAVPRLAASSSPILRQPTSLLFPHKKPLTFTTSSSSPHSRLHQPLKYSTVPKISAVISVGDKLPEATLSCIEPSGDVRTVPISDFTAGRRIIIVAVPGAFTPTCSQNHLPGFVEKAAEFKAKGIDAIVCISVNDAFVMKAWKADLKIRNEVLLLSDGNGDFTRAIGCELDLRDNPVGLGVRSRRYAMYIKNGVVKILNLEEGGAVRVSSAEQMLEAI